MVVASLSLNAQVKDEAMLKEMINSKSFVFKPRTVSPMTGGSRIVSAEYDLAINNSKVVSFLPYFGRAYSATPYAADGGIKFTSTDFTYHINESKRGWKITIQPKDAEDIKELYLDITKSGYASLLVSSNSRQGISFYGVVEMVKQ